MHECDFVKKMLKTFTDIWTSRFYDQTVKRPGKSPRIKRVKGGSDIFFYSISIGYAMGIAWLKPGIEP